MTRPSQKKPPDQISPAAAVAIGVARRDITPPVGIYARQWGAAAHDAAEGVHRPLCANIMALREAPGGAPAVLVTFDGGWWQDLDDERRLRSAVIEAHGLDPARLLIALSHTHAACSLCSEDADKPGGHLVEGYLQKIADALIDGVKEAIQNLAPGTLTWATGRCDLAANRDLPDPEADRYLCGFNPDEPADDTLVVGRATDDGGKIIATLVNYACHPTTLAWDNRLVSPDYVGAMRETIERHTGNAPCLFLQGASGDLGPREGLTGETAVADANGRRLGFAALAMLESMLPPGTGLTYAGIVESGAPLATWKRTPIDLPTGLTAQQVDIDLPLKNMPSIDEVCRQLDACTDRVLAERLRRKVRLLRKIGTGPTCAIPTWFWRIGETILVAHPNETYSALQTTLRRRFPERTIVVVTVVNGGIGYISRPECHDQDLYQVWQSPFDRDALPTVIRACETQIERIIRER